MDDFNNKLENENQTAENKAAETQTPAAEPQAQQPAAPESGRAGTRKGREQNLHTEEREEARNRR